MIVQAAVARHPDRPVVIETLELDEPRVDEVLVRLVASGVSNADLAAIADGSVVPFPLVPGGEGAGIVERVGSAVTGLEPGDAVVLTFASCGECQTCSAGQPRECVARADLNTSGRRLDGSAPFVGDGTAINGFFQGQSSFSTHVLCHQSCAIRVANGAPLEILACLGGALQATASVLIRGYMLKAEDSIVITGAGAEGLVATMVAAALGVKTIVVADPREERRARATDLGATLVVHTDDDLASVVKSLTGVGASHALDTTGHEAAIEACRASLAPDGLLGATDLVSTPAAIIAILAEWHGEGRFPLETLVTFFPFEHINDALDALSDETAVKPIVRFSIGSFGDLDRADRADADIEAPTDEPHGPSEMHDPATVTAI